MNLDLIHILAGLIVGLVVGLTSVGSGALMTAILILGLGINPSVAIGTNLIYSAVSKINAAWFYSQHKQVHWPAVLYLGLGSIPAALITGVILQNLQNLQDIDYNKFIINFIGIILIITAGLILFKNKILSHSLKIKLNANLQILLTIIAGLLLGIMVTLTSIGAGAVSVAILSFLYPNCPTHKIIGTNLVHAVPLSLIAGLGYWQLLASVDLMLLLGLLIGAYPGVFLGSRLGLYSPEHILRFILAVVLLLVGVNFLIR